MAVRPGATGALLIGLGYVVFGAVEILSFHLPWPILLVNIVALGLLVTGVVLLLRVQAREKMLHRGMIWTVVALGVVGLVAGSIARAATNTDPFTNAAANTAVLGLTTQMACFAAACMVALWPHVSSPVRLLAAIAVVGTVFYGMMLWWAIYRVQYAGWDIDRFATVAIPSSIAGHLMAVPAFLHALLPPPREPTKAVIRMPPSGRGRSR